LRVLTFDIGFYRKMCENNIIRPRSVRRFQFTHAQREIGSQITFAIEQKHLAGLKNDFKKYIGVVQKYPVPYARLHPLLQGELCICKPEDMQKQNKLTDAWESLSDHLNDFCKKHADELGENVCAVSNAITDFASHPRVNRCVRGERHTFQKLVGDWMNEFYGVCSVKDFNLGDDLIELVKRPEKKR